jgi:probable HAF family extracellular repeat protein
MKGMRPDPFRPGRAYAAALLAASLLGACSDGSPADPGPDPDPQPAVVAEIRVELDNPVLAVGRTLQIAAAGADEQANLAAPVLVRLLDAQGNAIVDRVPAYATSDAGVATVSSTGLVTAVGAGAASITATSGTASAVVHVFVERPYAVTILEGAGDTESHATAINAAGAVTGWFRTGGADHAFLWQDGTRTDLGTGRGYAVNDAGAVGGASADLRAAVWSDGAATPVDEGSEFAVGRVVGINAAGDLAYSETARSCGPGGNCYWRSFVRYDGEVTALTTDLPDATGIGPAGQVVGRFWQPGVNPRAFVYAGGAFTALSPEALRSEATAINAAGQVVGTRRTTPGIDLPTLWNGGTATDLGLLRRGDQGYALAVNAGATVVGRANLCDRRCETFVAARWRGGRVADLNLLVPAATAWNLVSATGVNDAGQIVGTAVHRTSGATRAFLLTPAS